MPKTKIINSAGITAAIGLASLPVFLMLSPVSMDNASAMKTTAVVSGSVVSPSSANITPTLGLSATNVSVNLDPNTSSTVFGTDHSTVKVSTNNETGYTLKMSDTDGNNNLKHQTISTNTPIIASISSDTVGSSLKNQWGYNFVVTKSENSTGTTNATNNQNTSSSVFKKIPTALTDIRTTTEASNDTIEVNYGVGINTSIPSGTYSSSVTFTAVTNQVPANFYNIEFMDEMTHAICQNTPTPAAFVDGEVNAEVPQTVLTDRRDGETYIVRKLADGNCWMSQNLKLSKETATYPGITGKAAGVLEPTYTDMESGTFELPASQTEGTTVWNSTRAHIYTDINNTYYENGLTKKTGDGGSPEYYQGNYYNFYAATMNSTSTSSYPNDAPKTICPKNWTLPANGSLSNNEEAHVDKAEYATAITTGFNSSNKSSYSFTNLLQVYRMAYTNHWGSFSGDTATYNKAAPIRLRATPLSFPASGGYYYDSGLVYQGSCGYWRSSTATTAANAIRLVFNYSRVYPQDSFDRSHGFSVRCVAK